MMSDVPPSIVFACARRNPRATVRGSSLDRRRDEARRALVLEQARALPRDAVGALEVDGELLQPLVELRLLQLRDRALGPGLGAALALVAGALVVRAGSAGSRCTPAPAAGAASGSATGAVPVDAAGATGLPPTASPPIGAGARERHPLVHQRGDRDLPAVALAAEHSSRVGTRASLKNTSLNSASPVICTQRPHLDAGLLHVDDEVAEALVLGHVGVGAARAASRTWRGARAWSTPSAR